LKLLVDIRNISVVRKVFAARRCPVDIQATIEPFMIRSPLSAKLVGATPLCLVMTEVKLVKDLRQLGARITEDNDVFFFNSFDPDKTLTATPEPYSNET
jgi:hypothetical protein